MPRFMGPYTLAYARKVARSRYRGARVAKRRPMRFSRTSRRTNARSLRNIPPELKFFDTAVSFLADNTLEVPATGQWVLIPQGDTQSTRDGRLAIIKSIQFRGVITGADASMSMIGITFYMWVIQDTQANGAAATAADVFTGANVHRSFLIEKALTRLAVWSISTTRNVSEFYTRNRSAPTRSGSKESPLPLPTFCVGPLSSTRRSTSRSTGTVRQEPSRKSNPTTFSSWPASAQQQATTSIRSEATLAFASSVR